MNTTVVDRGIGIAKGAAFTTTHWSVVRSAGQRPSPEADVALESLCRAYWYPLYAFVRRRGHDLHDAQDLTQEFFARLLEKDFLQSVDRRKGKFRSFLLAALEHFLANEWRRVRTRKRGGGYAFISIDGLTAEQKYLQVPSSGLSPDRLFEQQWAILVLGQALDRLGKELVSQGKETLFQELKEFLTGERRAGAYAQLAQKLGMTENSVKMAVSRLRRRYVELLRAEVANTIAESEDVDEELRALFSALRT